MLFVHARPLCRVDLEPPLPLPASLPPALRAKLVDWLAPVLEKPLAHFAVAHGLKFPPERLAAQPDSRCAASAALVWATGDDAPVPAAVRILDALTEVLGKDEPEEDDLLAFWLGQVAAEHAQLAPYFQRQAEGALLERVYVELDLTWEPGVAESGPPRLGGPLDLRQVLALDRGHLPWVTGRWVVLGDPGAGKTTLLRHLTATLAAQADRRWAPLFESLPRLLREGRSLLDRVVRRLELAGHPAQGLKALLDQKARQGRLLVLLDGLDEVPPQDQERAGELLRDLSTRWPEAPIVVASRRIGYSRPGRDYRELALVPLDRGRRRAFLARWLGRKDGMRDEARAEAAMAAVEAPELRELAGNPLYLTLMALLLESGQSPERNRTKLYDQVFAMLLKGRHRLYQADPIEEPQAVRRALAHLASSLTLADREAEPPEQLAARLYEPRRARSTGPSSGSRAGATAFGRFSPTWQTLESSAPTTALTPTGDSGTAPSARPWWPSPWRWSTVARRDGRPFSSVRAPSPPMRS